uniref:Ig-like domain-containing protein n=1 Tax=Knipowitschia caucasica TaxID=637954 RepID=A0AAV2KS44_KNICA
MDAYYLLFWLQVCMNAWLSQAATENFLVSVTSNMSVHTMQTTILPCWLSPPQSAEDMEVNWFHSKFDTPIMLYKDKTINNASRPASYSDRVSFGHKDASSTGLKAGDVSLKLVNVTTADAGEYTCYVSSDKHHDHASLNLFVSQTGVEPLLTAVVNEVDKMNVSCESEGWYPKPLLHCMLVLGADPFSKHASNEDPSESEKLLDTDYKYVNIDLEKNGNESILIKNNRLRESCDAAEKESRVTCATAAFLSSRV